MRRFSLSLLLAIAPLCGAADIRAETRPEAPSFFNQKERLPLPSLQGIARLRFVTTVDFAPFSVLGTHGQLSGYNIDLAKALCQQLGIGDICQVEAVPWNELEERLLSGQADAIIAGWTPTAGNREKFSFSRSYMRLPARFVTTNAGSFREAAAVATKGMAVGVLDGTAHAQLLKSYFPQAAARPYSDRAAMLDDLKAGKLGAVFDDGMSLSLWLDSPEGNACCAFTDGPYMAPQYLGSGLSIAVTRRNAALAGAFNNALQALQQNGVLTELYLRYFPNSFY